MQRWKSRGGKSQGGEDQRWRRAKREKVRSEKMQVREKVGKSRFTAFFQWFGVPEGRKVTSLKRRVQSQLARGEMKHCTPLWREANVKSKCTKHVGFKPLLEVELSKKVHAVVVRSTVPSQKCQKPMVSDHFWKLRCRKSARRWGAKHISKSKVSKTHGLRPLLEVEMSKRCAPLWREAHCQVKSLKNWGVRTTSWRSEVDKVHTD